MVSAGSAWDTAYALNYDPALADRGLSHLSAADKQALVAFMGTLTDTAFAADPKFSSPFRR
ncbi:MAG: hypothetical protein ACK5PW_22625 [Burkholderiales bacterium]|jgi:hypothetical protein